MKIRHYSIMEECYICFERKKLYNICKTCNHNICDKCIISMIDENNVYFTEIDVKYKIKCPYCRTLNSNSMRKNELVMMYKKLIKKNQEYMTEIRLQDELIQMQTLAYRRTIENIKDKIYNKINAIMLDITNGVLNGNWIYTSLENILDYINKLNRIYS